MARPSICCLTTVLVWTVSLLEVSYSDVYTSSTKIQEMAVQEVQILNNLRSAINNLGNGTASTYFLQFYEDRLPHVKERQNDPNLEKYLRHPNGIYHIIKQFAFDYQNLRSALGPAPFDVQRYLSSIADMNDLTGARLSFLRLQIVYSLSASDMIKGDYFGLMGPELSGEDALEIAEVTFKEGYMNYAIDWLQAALELTSSREPSAGFGFLDDKATLTGRIYALLGRSYIRTGNDEKAREMYLKAQRFDPNDAHMIELERELVSKPHFIEPKLGKQGNTNFTRLCTLQNKLTKVCEQVDVKPYSGNEFPVKGRHVWSSGNNKFDHRLVCSYKMVILPYYRFKMELVSVSPYVALFYDVISDFEGSTIINAVKGKLYRGVVVNNGAAATGDVRISDLSFVEDNVSSVIAGMSKRVAAITNLNTKPYVDGGDYSSEPFQVVNYGMGGHYVIHDDTFDKLSQKAPVRTRITTNGGNRLATFLIYLSDVERGGSTVFVDADIAVSPVKNMALFWYNFKPSGKKDRKTNHAGCPVVVGHKWVSNKWLWLHGNAFYRRCGLRRNATQVDIDQQMRKGWV